MTSPPSRATLQFTGGFATLGRRGLALSILLGACGHHPDSGQHATPSFPIQAGLAVMDSAGNWCAEFSPDSTQSGPAPGSELIILFPDSGRGVSAPATIAARRDRACATAFPQPRWDGYTAFDVAPDSGDAIAPPGLPVGIVVMGRATWTRGTDGLMRSPIESDASQVTALRCAADEGEHFLMVSELPDGRRLVHWHEYFDWGAVVDSNCPPGVTAFDDRLPSGRG